MSVSFAVNRIIDKSKINVDSYLSGGGTQRKEQSSAPSGMIRGGSQVPNSQNAPSSTIIKTKLSKS